jgi:hypothetical protein
MNIFSPRRDGLATFILLGCACILCVILNIVTSVPEWKQGKYVDLLMDAFYLWLEVFGAVLCFLCARLVIRGRKREWEEQEKFIAERRALRKRV